MTPFKTAVINNSNLARSVHRFLWLEVKACHQSGAHQKGSDVRVDRIHDLVFGCCCLFHSCQWKISLGDLLMNERAQPLLVSLTVNIYVYSHIWSTVLVVAIESLVWWSTDRQSKSIHKPSWKVYPFSDPREKPVIQLLPNCFQIIWWLVRKVKYPSVAGPAPANPLTCFDGAPRDIISESTLAPTHH